MKRYHVVEFTSTIELEKYLNITGVKPENIVSVSHSKYSSGYHVHTTIILVHTMN